MNKALAILLFIGLFIFIAPVCVMAGACGGCLFGAVLSPVSDTAAGFAMGGGSLIGLAAGFVIPALVIRGINNSQRRRDSYGRPQY